MAKLLLSFLLLQSITWAFVESFSLLKFRKAMSRSLNLKEKEKVHRQMMGCKVTSEDLQTTKTNEKPSTNKEPSRLPLAFTGFDQNTNPDLTWDCYCSSGKPMNYAVLVEDNTSGIKNADPFVHW